MLWSQKLTDGSRVSFSFDPDVQNSTVNPKNLFTEGPLRAVWAVGYPADYALLPAQDANNPQYYHSLATATYSNAAKELRDRKFEYAYLNDKINFADKIARLLYDATRPITGTIFNNTAFGDEVKGLTDALGYSQDPLTNAHTGAIKAIMDAPKRGSRTVAGSAANIIVTDDDVKNFLADAGTTQFQKNVIEAIIVYFENAVVDPYFSVYTIEDFGYAVINPLITALGTQVVISSTITLADIQTEIAKIKNNSQPKSVNPKEDQFWSNAGRNAVYDKVYAANTEINRIQRDSYKQIQHEDASWVSLIVEDNPNDWSKRTYLSVDTGFITTTQHLGFKVQKFADVGTTFYTELELDNLTRLDLNGRFNFQFHYFPTQDSIVIRAGGFAKKLDTQKNWGALNTSENPDLGIEKAGVHPSKESAITDAYAAGKFFSDRNVVKLQLLTNQSEVTIGSSEFAAGKSPRTTVNTHIQIGRNALTDNRTTLESGLYFINLKTGLPDRAQINGAYKYRHIAGSVVGLTWAHEDASQLADGKIQNFGYMPAAQWVVEKYPYGDGKTNLVSIYNREYPDIKVGPVQLYSTENGAYAFSYSGSGSFPESDTLSFTQISKTEFPKAYSDEYLGYYKEETDKFYLFDYLSGIKLGNYLKVLDSRTDSLIYVDITGDKVFFELEEVTELGGVKTEPTGKFGFTATSSHSFKQLKRTAYNIRIKAPHLLFADGKYIIRTGSATGENQYAVSASEDKTPATFFLKENNRIKTTPYFALEEVWYDGGTKLWYEGSWRVGVKDGSLYLTGEDNSRERRVSAFALTETDIYLYRRFDNGDYKVSDGILKEPYGDSKNSPLYLKFFSYNNYKQNFLSENSTNSSYGKENNYRNELNDTTISFLGQYNISQFEESKNRSYTFFVDTAYVRGNTVMPQYLLALRPEIQEEDRWIYKGEGQWFDSEDNPVTPPENSQREVYFPRLVKGDYLFNAQDSVSAGNKDYEGKFAYGAEKTTRLAFVTGAHLRDTFYVLPKNYNKVDFTQLTARQLAKDTLALYGLPAAYKHRLDANTHYLSEAKQADNSYIVTNHKSMVFQFRLIDEQNRRFLIETTRDRSAEEIGPSKGQWVKIQNGVPVISQNTNIAVAQQNGAEIFDVTDDAIDSTAVSNEAVLATSVKVVSEVGAVTILNAAGKKVSVSNILGQTVANAILPSDNARVALPKGIVIVAVEGEPAVKAVVK
jgi:hypothetical protein